VADAIGLLDLTTVLLWSGAFILASLAYYVAQAIAAPLNISIPLVGRPFAGIANTIQNAIVSPLNDLRAKSDAQISKGLAGLADSLELLIGLTGLLGLGVLKALKYLWGTALSPFIHAITNPIRTTADNALSDVEALTKTVADDLAKAESYADGKATDALNSAKSYADTKISAAIATTEGYADNAVAKLRAAEDTAIANAVDLANAAKAAGIAAAAAVLTEAEAKIAAAATTAQLEAVKAESDAEAFAASAAAQVEATVDTSISQVKAIAIGAAGDLTDFEGYIGSLNLPTTIGAVGAIAALLTVVLSDTGLGNADCRAKVKGICGTDPLAWAGLLIGITALGIEFDLADIVDAALTILDDTYELLADVGNLTADEVDRVGTAIGQAALAIAA
jgi:hypothetical protein